MKNMWKYILIALGTVALEWIFLALMVEVFNGLSHTEGIMMCMGFFLAFEMVICTGVIISKIDKNKDK